MGKNIFLMTFILINIYACANADNKMIKPAVQNVATYDIRISELENDLSDLQKKVVLEEDFNNKVLDAQRANYDKSVSVLIWVSSVVISVVVALTGFIGFFGIRKDFKRRIDNTALNLESRFNGQIKDLLDNANKENQDRFKKLEDTSNNHERLIFAKIYNNLGRLYQEQAEADSRVLSKDAYAFLSVMWFARDLREHIKLDEEYWVQLALDNVERMLEMSKPITVAEDISELNKIFSSIDGVKYKDQKQRIKDLLDKKIKERI